MKIITWFNTQKRRIRIVGYGAISALVLASATYGQQFVLHDGDTVVFYGDSITAQRLYTKDVEEFLLTRYPKLHVTFVNAGVPGDNVNGGYAGTVAERVLRDVQPSHPTMISVMLGMNDGGWGYGPPDVDANFQKGYRALLDALHTAAPNATLTLICPPTYDEIPHGTEFPGYARVIDRFAEDVSQIGLQLQASGDKSVLFADFNRPLTDALQRAKTQYPELAPLIVPDRIHPSETGHWIMAAALLSAWHVDPIVSSVTMNAARAEILENHRATVTSPHLEQDNLKWSQQDDALPLPLDFNNAMTPMLLAISDLGRIDQQILRIESLAIGDYDLLIDGRKIAAFTSGELQHGVNLALLKTPMVDHARDIASREDQRVALDYARFILRADVEQSPTSGSAEDTLLKASDDLAMSIRKGLDPKLYRFELRKK